MKRILFTLLFAAPMLAQTVTGKFAQGESYVELAYHVSEGKVRIPPDKPDIPKHVVDALLRGLKPAPDDRFPDMGDLLDALQPAPKRKRMWIWMGAAAATASRSPRPTAR